MALLPNKDDQPYLDYERFNLDALHERDLDEATGLNVRGFDFPIRAYDVRYYSDGALSTKGRSAPPGGLG